MTGFVPLIMPTRRLLICHFIVYIKSMFFLFLLLSWMALNSVPAAKQVLLLALLVDNE